MSNRPEGGGYLDSSNLIQTQTYQEEPRLNVRDLDITRGDNNVLAKSYHQNPQPYSSYYLDGHRDSFKYQRSINDGSYKKMMITESDRQYSYRPSNLLQEPSNQSFMLMSNTQSNNVQGTNMKEPEFGSTVDRPRVNFVDSFPSNNFTALKEHSLNRSNERNSGDQR